MDDTQKQPRNPNDLLIFQNIDTEDHEWQYDTIKTPLPYYIRAGETRELPFFIATHGIEKLIDKMLLKAGKIHTSPLLRAELRNRIFLGIRHINYIKEKTPNELALEAMQRKKDTDPYEELIKEREILAEQQKAAAEAAMQPKAPLIQTMAQPVQTVPQYSNEVPPVGSVIPAINTIPIVADPERQQVYQLLQTKLHLQLDHVPTKEKFDSMSVNEIKQAFAAELPELGITPAPTQPLGIVGSQPLGSSVSQPAQVAPSLSNPAPLLDQQFNAIQ